MVRAPIFQLRTLPSAVLHPNSIAQRIHFDVAAATPVAPAEASLRSLIYETPSWRFGVANSLHSSAEHAQISPTKRPNP